MRNMGVVSYQKCICWDINMATGVGLTIMRGPRRCCHLAMFFNKSRKYDFPTEMSVQDGIILECVEETKLFGVQLSSSLKWDSNTSIICAKAMSKMWLLGQLKKFNLDHYIILDYYLKEICPSMEHSVPIWTSGLTKAQVREVENVQKVALKIILADTFRNNLSTKRKIFR